jgi:hypothetical protein
VAGRAFAFADDEIIRLATEEFVAVAADDWYQRRRRDDEGEFFRAVANQGPQRGGVDGTDTRQGIYLFTASGKLLAYRNAGQNPAAMRDAMTDALKKWRVLPESERRPGAVEVGSPEIIDRDYARRPPPRGLIANVHARALDRGKDAGFADAACTVGAGNEPSLDHLWLTESEWRSLVPVRAKPGDRLPVPRPVADRLLRFHFVDHTRGEPTFWRREEIRRGDLGLTVERSDESGVDLRVDGSVLLETSDNSRGYDAAVAGKITYQSREDRITRFDVVAPPTMPAAAHCPVAP